MLGATFGQSSEGRSEKHNYNYNLQTVQTVVNLFQILLHYIT